MPDASAPTPFAHLQAKNIDLYRSILATFVQAKERFTVHLRPEDVLAELGEVAELEAVTNALEQLTEWGNLRSDPDTGRVTTVEDFHRARYLYQLSPAGQAAEQAIAVYEQAVGARGALQSVALADIANLLRSLLALARETGAAGGTVDASRAHLLLMMITERFSGLAENAQAFMASLRRTIDFADTDLDAFVAYKERLITYIERFIADLANSGAEIASLVTETEQAGVADLLTAAARRDAADAVPGDPEAPEVDEAIERSLRLWRNRWAGLRAWFLSTDPGRPSQAKLLRSSAINAITQLLGAVAVINERRAGRSDRSADFRTLARWFATAPDDAAAHRLWRAAFGLCPARHLTVTPDSLDQWDADRLTANTPWSQAQPLRISPQLRRTGSYERRGQPSRVIDRSNARKLLEERARAEAEQTALARATLVTNGRVHLSDVKLLDPLAFRLFLALLGDALAARVPGSAEVTTATGDGTLWVRLTALPNAPTVEIETLDGILTGPDHLIEIVDLTTGSEERAPAASVAA